MNNDAFDKKLKSKLGGLTLPSTAHLWEGVTAALPEPADRKRRPMFWLWALLLLPLAGGYFWLQSEDNPIAMIAVKTAQPDHVAGSFVTLDEKQADEQKGNTAEMAVPDQVDENPGTIINARMEAPGKHSDAVLSSPNPTVVEASLNLNNAGNLEETGKAGFELQTSSILRQSGTVSPPALQAASDKLDAGYAPWPARRSGGELDCPPLNGKKNTPIRFFGEANAGLFLPFRQVEDDASKLPAQSDSFASKTSPQVSALASVMAGVYLTGNLTLKTGLQYARWHETFSYNNKAHEETITIITIRNVVLPTGDSVFIRDTTTQTIIGNRRIETTNVYQSFDIPIIFGFEFGKRTRFSANLGAVANLRTTYNGYVSDSLGKPIEISNNDGQFKRSMGWGIHAGLGMIMPLGERSYFIVEPHARLQLSNATSENASFQQRWITGGLQVGWRYIF